MRKGEVCGACTGALMVLGLKYGYSNADDKESKMKADKACDKFLDEFKKFALRGNVIDMAIGVVIGSAFSKITTSLVNDLIMPFFAMMCGNVNFTELKVILKETLDAEGNIVSQVTLNYGQFIQNIVDFVLIAFCLFLVVKFMNSLKKSMLTIFVSPIILMTRQRLC